MTPVYNNSTTTVVFWHKMCLMLYKTSFVSFGRYKNKRALHCNLSYSVMKSNKYCNNSKRIQGSNLNFQQTVYKNGFCQIKWKKQMNCVYAFHSPLYRA